MLWESLKNKSKTKPSNNFLRSFFIFLAKSCHQSESSTFTLTHCEQRACSHTARKNRDKQRWPWFVHRALTSTHVHSNSLLDVKIVRVLHYTNSLHNEQMAHTVYWYSVNIALPILSVIFLTMQLIFTKSNCPFVIFPVIHMQQLYMSSGTRPVIHVLILLFFRINRGNIVHFSITTSYELYTNVKFFHIMFTLEYLFSSQLVRHT